MKVRIFQAFKKVFTPRTPDSGYDSFGVFPPLAPIIMTPLLSTQMGTGVTLQNAVYYAGVAVCSATETMGSSVKLQSASYSPPPPIS